MKKKNETSKEKLEKQRTEIKKGKKKKEIYII